DPRGAEIDWMVERLSYDHLLDLQWLAGGALDPGDPSGMIAGVQRGRGSAVEGTGRALRYVTPHVHVAERDVVVARGRDLFGGNRGRALHVAIFHEESVRQCDIPLARLRRRNSGQRTVVGRMLHHRAAPDPSL